MTASSTRRTTAARTRLAAVGSLAVAGALLLSACGDQTKSGGSSSESSSGSDKAPLFSKLPADIQKAGVIKVGTNAEYAPMESVEGGKIVGVDPDIAAALGKQLGVDFQFTSGGFDTLITAVNTGRYDVAMSSITDNKQRQEGLDDKGKKLGTGVDFVDYFTSRHGHLRPEGQPQGHQDHRRPVWSDGRRAAGHHLRRGPQGAVQEVHGGRQEGPQDRVLRERHRGPDPRQVRRRRGGVNDYPVAVDMARKAGNGNTFEVLDEQYEAAPFGIVVDKKNTQLRDALKEAVDAIIKDGSYQKALEKWGAESGAIKAAAVNGGK